MHPIIVIDCEGPTVPPPPPTEAILKLAIAAANAFGEPLSTQVESTAVAVV
jgi:hypothetical protein